MDGITQNKISNFFKRNILIILCFALLAIYSYFLFYHLGQRSFIDWDESIYAQVSKEALLSHNYFSFTFWGSHWFEKPPLMIWATMLGYKIFGINELGARFFVPVFALATIILTLLLVKKITRSNLAVFLTAACFGICYQFFFHSFFLEFDIPVTFFILLSVYSFLLALEKPKFFYLFFTAVALGVLTKSVIGLLPLPILFIYLLVSGQFKKIKNRQFLWGIGLAALLILPWHIWETIKFGKSFWNIYLFYHVIERYLQPLENNGGPFSFYLPILWQNAVFTILLIISILYFAFQTLKKNYNYFLLLLASAFIFLFFSAAQTKGLGYIVVFYPFVLAMFGITLADFLNKSPSKILKISAVAILVAVFLALGWQEQNFKILRLENSPDAMYYDENRSIVNFILAKYPNKAVYGASWVEANLAFNYYLGKPVPTLPKDTPANLLPPKNFDQTPKYRIFHQVKRSVYNFPEYLYIAP